jgi:hypothetical protein
LSTTSRIWFSSGLLRQLKYVALLLQIPTANSHAWHAFYTNCRKMYEFFVYDPHLRYLRGRILLATNCHIRSRNGLRGDLDATAIGGLRLSPKATSGAIRRTKSARRAFYGQVAAIRLHKGSFPPIGPEKVPVEP